MRIGNPVWYVVIPDTAQPSSTFPAKAVVFSRRHIPVITNDKAMTCVEERQRTVMGARQWIQYPLEAGGFVNRLTERVGRGKLEPAGKPFLQRNLQRVIG